MLFIGGIEILSPNLKHEIIDWKVDKRVTRGTVGLCSLPICSSFSSYSVGGLVIKGAYRTIVLYGTVGVVANLILGRMIICITKDNKATV